MNVNRLFLVLLVFSSACASSNRPAIAGHPISSSYPVFVETITDVVDTDENIVAGSGESSELALRTELRRRGIPVVLTPTANGYTLRGTLTHWEHHAAQENGLPDAIELSLELIDAGTANVVATATAKKTGSMIQLFHETPNRLIKPAAADGIKKLYGLAK